MRLAIDHYPPFEDGVAYVVIPHDFFEVAREGGPRPRGTCGARVREAR